MESNYEKLVKALTCGNDGKLPCHNNECPYWVDQWHGIGFCNVIKKDADAAAAIEALQAEVAFYKKRLCELCGTCPDDMSHPNNCEIAGHGMWGWCKSFIGFCAMLYMRRDALQQRT